MHFGSLSISCQHDSLFDLPDSFGFGWGKYFVLGFSHCQGSVYSEGFIVGKPGVAQIAILQEQAIRKMRYHLVKGSSTGSGVALLLQGGGNLIQISTQFIKKRRQLSLIEAALQAIIYMLAHALDLRFYAVARKPIFAQCSITACSQRDWHLTS
jgi:hypothetical protein